MSTYYTITKIINHNEENRRKDLYLNNIVIMNDRNKIDDYINDKDTCYKHIELYNDCLRKKHKKDCEKIYDVMLLKCTGKINKH